MKYLVKLGNFKTKSSPNVELIKVDFGRFFDKKNLRPIGEISPHLIILVVSCRIQN
jgi:hypothetical protein